jgi:hypothetical protein
MTLSTNFYASTLRLLGAALLYVYGCSTAPGPVLDSDMAVSTGAGAGPIAVLPIVNFSNSPAHLSVIDQQWSNRLKKKGLHILGAQLVDDVITRNRIRYTGGLDPKTAQVFRTQAGAEAVLITVLELYSEASPPKIALNARLVSTSEQPRILWIDGIGMAGDDAPGLLDLGLIEDPARLMGKAMDNLSDSLARYTSSEKKGTRKIEARRVFRPQMSFRSLAMDPGRTYRVAIVPFFNLSDRNRAGDFIALIFARALGAYDNFMVVEPGTVRQQLLDMRIIMPSGISLANADLVFDRLDADLILNGEVLDYQDYQGAGGQPKVDFSAQIIERKSRQVVWTIKSHNTGHDGVGFFGMGKANTAHELARQMVAMAVEEIFQ